MQSKISLAVEGFLPTPTFLMNIKNEGSLLIQSQATNPASADCRPWLVIALPGFSQQFVPPFLEMQRVELCNFLYAEHMLCYGAIALSLTWTVKPAWNVHDMLKLFF